MDLFFREERGKTAGILVICIWIFMMDAVGSDKPVPEELLERCRKNPTILRRTPVYRDFDKYSPESYTPLMQAIVADNTQPLDVRARALLLVPFEKSPGLYETFAREFKPEEAAGAEDGAKAVNFLAKKIYGRRQTAGFVRHLILPGENLSGVGVILKALAGRPCHDYLHMLYGQGYSFSSHQLRLLSMTSDQATRRFIYWYIGDKNIAVMERFLSSEIASSRPSTYGGRGLRLLLMAFTGGMSELMRAALPPPDWLDEEKTPKDLALASLGQLIPLETSISHPEITENLLKAAVSSAESDEVEDYRLAANILLFLYARKADLRQPAARKALASLARLIPQEDARNETFALAQQVHGETGIPLPNFSKDEIASIWNRAFKTLNWRFLGAVVRAFPDPEREKALAQHLLDLGEKAQSGRLRFPSKNETWLCIHDSGDWSLCAAELHIEKAVPLMEKILDSYCREDAASALMRFGPAGLPVLTRFLMTKNVGLLKKDVRKEAVRICVQNLAPDAVPDFMLKLLGNPGIRVVARDVLQEMGPEGQAILKKFGEKQ